MYRILWKYEHGDELSATEYATVTEAVGTGNEMARWFTDRKLKIGFEICWAGSGHPIPEHFRQSCLERGE